MTAEDLIQIEAEMRAAFKRRKETREALVAAKGELADRRADHVKACEAVDALVLQLGTGQRQSVLPGIVANGNGHAEPIKTESMPPPVPGRDGPKPKLKTFAVYVRDPVDHGKAGRGLGYIDAASKEKALGLATKRWPAIKPA